MGSSPESPMEPRGPKTPAWEVAAVLVAVVALWPMIYARHEPYARVLMYAAGALMLVVFVRKIRRFRALWKQGKKE